VRGPRLRRIASFDTWLTTYGISVFRNTADDMGGGVYVYAPAGRQDVRLLRGR